MLTARFSAILVVNKKTAKISDPATILQTLSAVAREGAGGGGGGAIIMERWREKADRS